MLKKVMAIIDKINTQNLIKSKTLLKDNLDKKEITIILNLIKGTSFMGKDIETLYDLIIKLQNQYENLKDE
jgi:hypothetical protein|tara:strand:- start:2417 stop:2629 length:213 start_codon:yes stop_codon:yes gene_type:complete